MKITQVEAMPLKTGPILVRVYTDEGLLGIGEASGRNRQVLKPFIEDILGSLVLGKDPRSTNQLWEEMFFSIRRHEYCREFSGPREEVEALFEEPLIPEDGHITLPERPGLGLEVNPKALERLKLE